MTWPNEFKPSWYDVFLIVMLFIGIFGLTQVAKKAETDCGGLHVKSSDRSNS
jgi:hypothetical protein